MHVRPSTTRQASSELLSVFQHGRINCQMLGRLCEPVGSCPASEARLELRFWVLVLTAWRCALGTVTTLRGPRLSSVKFPQLIHDSFQKISWWMLRTALALALANRNPSSGRWLMGEALPWGSWQETRASLPSWVLTSAEGNSCLGWFLRILVFIQVQWKRDS